MGGAARIDHGLHTQGERRAEQLIVFVLEAVGRFEGAAT
jgi:hypothetical protein